MTPRTRQWLGLASGIIAGFALLASLFGSKDTTIDLSLLAISFSMACLALSASRRRGCAAQKDRR
ncbi:MAG: hypothetical protein WCO82_04870 [Sphingomonadales bacterium]|jgi:hypothetical protein